MLQFITAETERYTLAEQVRMAIDGGCAWIQLSAGAVSSPQFSDEVGQIVEMCREAGVFLLLTHDVELCDKLRIHGVHLTPGDMTPREARQRLGAHAVIGVTVTTAAEVILLKTADVDYVHIGPFDSRFSVDDYADIVREVRAADVDIPVVAVGDIPVEMIDPLLEAGVSGVALSSVITDATDPVERIRTILDTAR